MSPSLSHPHLKGETTQGSGPSAGVYGSYNDLQYEGVDFAELVEQLAETESLSEQADIIHYLYLKKSVLPSNYSPIATFMYDFDCNDSCRGLDWDTRIDGQNGCQVRDLLAELYDKAGECEINVLYCTQ